jgi:hypothetical protein
VPLLPLAGMTTNNRPASAYRQFLALHRLPCSLEPCPILSKAERYFRQARVSRGVCCCCSGFFSLLWNVRVVTKVPSGLGLRRESEGWHAFQWQLGHLHLRSSNAQWRCYSGAADIDTSQAANANAPVPQGRRALSRVWWRSRGQSLRISPRP